MTEDERVHVASLMRVNHCGEVCAQALYQGQALTSRDPQVRLRLQYAAWEETEHLHWTAQRIEALGGRTSALNPVFYFGSLGLGLIAGTLGDKWSLGFLAETERQVEAHLEAHKMKLPALDQRSYAVLEQMRIDEASHAEMARGQGAAELPPPIKLAMKLSARVMTGSTYYF